MVNPGKINQIIGPVIDVRFEGEMPPVYEKLVIKDTETVLEVLSHVGEGVVRCISMTATDGLSRGMQVLDTGGQIQVPVGEGVLGRVLNVLGEPIDHKGPVDAKEHWSIHRKPPAFYGSEGLSGDPLEYKQGRRTSGGRRGGAVQRAAGREP